jgi:hypothetical protein
MIFVFKSLFSVKYVWALKTHLRTLSYGTKVTRLGIIGHGTEVGGQGWRGQ